MNLAPGNLLADLPPPGEAEDVRVLHSTPRLRIERIVSHGHASPPDFWYDQDEAEWVLVVSGEAGLEIEGEAAPRRLGPGDYLMIPPHRRHRVAWTAADRPTVWLAVYGAVTV